MSFLENVIQGTGGPIGGSYGNCVAFPPGGKWDTGQCCYMR